MGITRNSGWSKVEEGKERGRDTGSLQIPTCCVTTVVSITTIVCPPRSKLITVLIPWHQSPMVHEWFFYDLYSACEGFGAHPYALHSSDLEPDLNQRASPCAGWMFL